jgi:hypothetical protein
VTVAPDLVEPIVGWRIWRITRNRGEARLSSYFYRSEWPVLEPLRAQCSAPRMMWTRERRCHLAPAPYCVCGVHGAHWQLFAAEIKRSHLARKPRFALGEVALWGTVVEAERGWRAEFAYPRRLFVPLRKRGGPFEDFKLALELGAYGVDVELFDAPNAATALAEIENRAAVTPRT